MTAVLDVGGLADCFIGLYEGKAGEDILDTYAEVRREKFLKYVDARSIKNLNRVATSDPWTVLETDKFFGILRELEGDDKGTKQFLLVGLQRSIARMSANISFRKIRVLSTISQNISSHDTGQKLYAHVEVIVICHCIVN